MCFRLCKGDGPCTCLNIKGIGTPRRRLTQVFMIIKVPHSYKTDFRTQDYQNIVAQMIEVFLVCFLCLGYCGLWSWGSHGNVGPRHLCSASTFPHLWNFRKWVLSAVSSSLVKLNTSNIYQLISLFLCLHYC